MQVDPLACKYPSWSPYNYTLNNPINAIDSDGREPTTVTLIAGGGLVVATGAAIWHNYKMATDPVYRDAAVGAARTTATAVKEAVGSFVEGVTSLFSESTTETSESDTESKGNSNPYDGPVDGDVNVVDPEGNVIPVKAGEQVKGSKDGKWIQVQDSEGNPTGTRKDGGGHPKQKDPKSQKPHGHRVDENGKPFTDETGNPHLEIK